MVIKTLRQGFREPEIFRASVAIIGKDARLFISRMRRLKEILRVDINLFREGR